MSLKHVILKNNRTAKILNILLNSYNTSERLHLVTKALNQ